MMRARGVAGQSPQASWESKRANVVAYSLRHAYPQGTM